MENYNVRLETEGRFLICGNTRDRYAQHWAIGGVPGTSTQPSNTLVELSNSFTGILTLSQLSWLLFFAVSIRHPVYRALMAYRELAELYDAANVDVCRLMFRYVNLVMLVILLYPIQRILSDAWHPRGPGSPKNEGFNAERAKFCHSRLGHEICKHVLAPYKYF